MTKNTHRDTTECHLHRRERERERETEREGNDNVQKCHEIARTGKMTKALRGGTSRTSRRLWQENTFYDKRTLSMAHTGKMTKALRGGIVTNFAEALIMTV